MSETGIKPLLVKKEVQEILKVSRTHLEHLMELGIVKYIDVSLPGSKKRHARFRRDHIEQLIGTVDIEPQFNK